ncbi:MAG: beta-ketoacyl synthase N-terminal-like domain-containing protein [Candidatus Peribacteraceae bacterium]|nr:beta-ketoacyl synthase N-terminal-like domain-containing protein [Candidatus Peribacteraceae bacterium]MDD5741957.1 beta-ketoacyl synthase N-terminal-like domain-containing protein [Candidatus Peribacteraceae bacterium]
MNEICTRDANNIVIVATGSISPTGENPAASHTAALQHRTGLRELTPDDIPNFDLLAKVKGLTTADERAAFFRNAWGDKCGVGGLIPKEYFPDPAGAGYPKGYFKAGERLVGVSVLQTHLAFEQTRRRLQTLFCDEGRIRADLAKRTMIDVATGAGSSVEMMESALIEFLMAGNDKALGESYGKSGWLLGMLGNMSAGQLAAFAGIEGAQSSSNSACASSGLSMFNGFNAIQAGAADIAFVGGSENPVGPVNTYLSFDHMMRRKGGALSRNWRERRGAEHALTAYGADRDGFVPGNAAGVIVMMRRRVADLLQLEPLVRVLGVAANTCQSRKFGKSLADGTLTGQAALLEELLGRSGIDVAAFRGRLVHYLHATGTHAGAINELYAAAKVFGGVARDKRYVGAGTKEGIGHTLAPAQIMNIIAAIEALREGTVAGFPSTEQVDPAFQHADPNILERERVGVDSMSLKAVADGIPCRTNVAIDASNVLVISTAAGFGGTNAAAAMVRE